jgi:hypothetical protein
VEFETPEDPVAEITALAAQGETAHLEYKRELPDKTNDSLRKVLKTVVAFANGEGGTMARRRRRRRRRHRHGRRAGRKTS